MEIETEKQEGRTAAGLGSRSSAKDTLKPRRAIRRYDIFAEYNRLERLDKGMDEPHAKGYGLWVAKVVARWHASCYSSVPRYGSAALYDVLLRGAMQGIGSRNG